MTATLFPMRTLLSDPLPAELEAFLERRKRLGLDRKDEVWEGVLHVVPAPDFRHALLTQQIAELIGPPARASGLLAAMGGFNLGDSTADYRVPDGGLHRPGTEGTWLPTAALVVEILSPDDETWNKLSFYAAHGVDELLIVDPNERSVTWLALTQGDYQAVQRSTLIDMGAAQLTQLIDWP